MLLVGLTGAIGHGKSTLAKALQQAHPTAINFETGQLVAKVANAWLSVMTDPLNPSDLNALNQTIKLLIPIIKAELGVLVSEADLRIDEQTMIRHSQNMAKLFEFCQQTAANPKLSEQMITTSNKEQYRPLLQWLGGFLVQQVGTGIWFDQLIRQAYEADSVGKASNSGGSLAIVPGVRFAADARIVRKNGGLIVLVSRPEHGEADLNDPTESQRHQIIPDCTVINNGSIAQLQLLAAQLQDDLVNNKLRKLYTAQNY